MRATVAKITPDEEMNIFRCKKKDIGTHSCRKGAASWCLGQVGGPNPVTVYLRMGHSLGKLKDRYIFLSEGQDQLCGRVASLINNY